MFNFEGGCYAKTIKLSKEAEPEIYNAIRRDALLENVTVREDGTIDFDDGSKTENTRVSYPIYHIDNIVKPVSKAGHATKVIFLTADAFGVLPPVSRLTADQTQYHSIRRDALLENVTVREDGTIDFDDGSKSENTRVSYPIYHIDNIVKPVSKAGHATKVIFLTAEAYGVLPPVSRLTADQTQYHFLSGFTAKLAGTERGITEPTPTFSAPLWLHRQTGRY